MSREVSALEQARNAYEPSLPAVLEGDLGSVAIEEGETTRAVADEDEIRARFPHTYGRPLLQLKRGACGVESKPLRVGVVLSGGQAPGGHNVITGLFDGLQSIHGDSRVFGFCGGPKGIFEDRHVELDAAMLKPFRNSGGFDLIGSGRDKIETEEQLEASRATCQKLALDGLVIIGGDDSNTNAAVLAEYFLERGSNVRVLGVPKTIDGDLRGGDVEISFGFDTATKVYSELIGNICRDARSAKKYWHFIKLMGRSASHVTLECALQTQANIALIGEEIQESEMTLRQIVERIATVVRRRAEADKHYGVCLVPEGLIEFIPEIRALIAEVNQIISDNSNYFDGIPSITDKQEFVDRKLTTDNGAAFSRLPVAIRQQLLLDRDSHGNVQVSRIDTEKLLIEKVEDQVAEWKAAGKFGGRFLVQSHFFGYEGRCAAPSNFDADYTYSLGRLAAVLAASNRTGYICGVANLGASPHGWRPVGVPLTSLMCMETRKGRPTPVISKALVRTDGEPFRVFAAGRTRWELDDAYLYPGAVQYFGPAKIASVPSRTLQLERAERTADV